MTGTELKNSIVPDSAKTFRFNEAYKLDLEEVGNFYVIFVVKFHQNPFLHLLVKLFKKELTRMTKYSYLVID